MDIEFFNKAILETDVPNLRAQALSPKVILNWLLKGLGSLFLRIPLGVGKSFAVDRLMSFFPTLKAYDLILYCSPSRSINYERVLYLKKNTKAIFTVLKPRPQKRCGALNERWLQLESQNCGVLGRATLCGVCPQRTKKRNPCTWPSSLKKKIEGKQIVIFAEQHFIIDNSFLLRIQCSTKAERVLLIFDEARLTHSNFEVKISSSEIESFRQALKRAKTETDSLQEIYDIWDYSLALLAEVSSEELNQKGWEFPRAINYHADSIQSFGITKSGEDFKYLGYVLSAFPYSKPAERWKDPSGSITFIARPYLKADILVLAAHFPAKYVANRLGLSKIESPFEKLRVRHSGTTIYNIKNSIGSERNFNKNYRQILDFYAALIIKNIKKGETTLLISRKKFKPLCKRYLEHVLAAAGHKVKILDNGKTPGTPVPEIIPLINYGVMGVNQYERYDNCFCLNSYYISEKTLEAALQSTDPTRFRVPVYIKDDGLKNRRVFVDREHRFSGLREDGGIYLKVLEADPVLQAIGRVRFCTNPRTIITFQKQDLSDEVGEVLDLQNLAEAYRVLRVIKLKTEARNRVCVAYIALKKQGYSLRAAAKCLGVDKATLSRWFRAYQALSQKPLKNIIRINETAPNSLDEGVQNER